MDAQVNYTTTEKELLAVFFALDKFRSYLLQEFDIEIWDKKGIKNVVVDHLSRILFETPQPIPVHDSFPNEQLFEITLRGPPWFVDIGNYLAIGRIPSHWSKQDMDRFFNQVRSYFWEDPELFKYYAD